MAHFHAAIKRKPISIIRDVSTLSYINMGPTMKIIHGSHLYVRGRSTTPGILNNSFHDRHVILDYSLPFQEALAMNYKCRDQIYRKINW